LADGACFIESADQCVPAAGRQCLRDCESLFEHVHQRIEVALIVVAEFATKPGGPLATEDHQLCQSGGFANCLLVIRNGLLGLLYMAGMFNFTDQGGALVRFA
jgi:hypothetical protein